MCKIIEDYMPFGGGKTYYRIIGENEPGKLPLLVFHGGPGGSHNYLRSLDDIAKNGHKVIYYDQIGCGLSPAPSDPKRWTPELFVEEAFALCEHLNLKEYHLLGQSWGGMLAIYFSSKKPEGLKSLILASSPVSIPMWNKESERLLDEMPEGPKKILKEGEASGIRDTTEYQNALNEFYAKHIFRQKEMPDYVIDSFSQMGEVYHTMQGDSELCLTGTLKDEDLTPLLKDIDVPTLITAGEYDQCTEQVVKSALDGIKDSHSFILKGCGHLAHVEERTLFNETVKSFIEEVESKLK